jgi:hypothetical protein
MKIEPKPVPAGQGSRVRTMIAQNGCRYKTDSKNLRCAVKGTISVEAHLDLKSRRVSRHSDWTELLGWRLNVDLHSNIHCHERSNKNTQMLWRRIFMAPSLPVATMNPRKEKETIAKRTAPKGRRKKTSERNCAKGSLKEIEMRCLN